MSPTRQKTSVTARQGVNFVRTLMEAGNCEFEDVHQEHDAGIDAYIEVKDDAGVRTGLRVGVQIKSGRSYRLKGGHRIRANKDHFQYWSRLNVPVVGIVFDPGCGGAFWVDITDFLKQKPSVIEDGPYVIHTCTTSKLSAGTFAHFWDYLLKRYGGGKHVLPDKSLEPERPPFRIPELDPKIVEAIVLLLLLDQYVDGVWGRSVYAVAGAYGHKNDPGSITVSHWASCALAGLSGIRDLPELKRFGDYLIKRQKRDGAVGMRRNIGSDYRPAYEIAENRRHTAMAASWWLQIGDALGPAVRAIEYVIANRGKDGAWSAVGDPSDSDSDPVSTAYILRVLLDFEHKGHLRGLCHKAPASFFTTYKQDGMAWLYRNLLDNDMWWLYRTADEALLEERLKRMYCYTASVVSMLPEFRNASDEHREAYIAVLRRLGDLWRKNRPGIPSGEGSDQAELETTSHFALACWYSRDRSPEFATKFLPRFVAGLPDMLENGYSDAAGWALTLQLLAHLGQPISGGPEMVARARKLAGQLWDAYLNGNTRRLNTILSLQPSWVGRIAKERIFPVTAVSP